jgi:HK97 family phage major capsid protein
MSTQLQKMRADFEVKTKRADEIINKADPTPEEATEAETLVNQELPALKSKIDSLAGLGGLKANLTELNSWNNDATPLVQPGANGGKKSVGKTEINLLTGEVVDESGEGLLSEHQIKATRDPQYLRAYNSFLRNRGIENMKSADEIKSLSEGIDTEGGFLVPPEILAGIIKREPAPTRMLDRVRTITVSSDRAMMLKSEYDVDDLYSSAVRVYKTAEGAAATKSDKPVFGTLQIDVHQFTAELSISRMLLEDTSFDLIGFVAEEFRTAYRNFLARSLLQGSGVGEHHGLLTRAGKAKGPEIVNSGHASQVTWTGLRKIKNAVPEQYDENSIYCFNKKSTQDAIEALVDNDGRPLWPESQRSGLENGVPGRLQGYGYIRDPFMPDVAANALAYWFGDPLGYYRAMRLGMSIEPLREIEARRGQVVFLARFRDGGDVGEPWRLKVGKIAA